MTGVFESLNTDMHSNQITSSNYHSLHKSQESPTLPVSTATDSSYYNSQQPGHCAGSPFGQLGSYQYHGGAASTVPYNAKSYDLGFNSSYGAYSSYGPSSSPTPADTGEEALRLILMHHACFLFETKFLKLAHGMEFLRSKLRITAGWNQKCFKIGIMNVQLIYMNSIIWSLHNNIKCCYNKLV